MSAEDYEMLTPVEHVRKRPDMYIGSIKNVKENRWILNENSVNLEAIYEEIEYNPGLEQCILELIVNAADHVERSKNKPKAERVSKIDVEHTNKYFSICNNGIGIPIEKHSQTGLYVPEMIFGNLLTSSNYDDNEKRTVGGRNGVGAKAANIFSAKFIIEVQSNGKNYVQEFSDGMNEKTDPEITKKSSKDYTKITFYPDFKIFGMKSFESNQTNLLVKKRVYDLSAVTSKEVAIKYNNNVIEFKDFIDYMNLYIKDRPKVVIKQDRWEVGFALNPYDSATQISFVNAICTEEGGTHVSHVLDPVINKVIEELQKKNKDLKIQRSLVKDNIIVFVKCLIENPSFSSQLKRKLETKVSDFGSKCEISENDVKKIVKLGIGNGVVEVAQAKELKNAMKKIESSIKNSRLTDIPKLDDANWAGSKDLEKRMKCTLILTEGDSAKTFAMHGIAAAGGSDIWGVFPLKGKPLNVRQASTKQYSENTEIISIIRILGLKENTRIIEELRYGKVMFITDADVDGYHIKGLLINFFTYKYPELVKQGFMQCMITPIVKIFNSKKEVVKKFYNLDDFKEWEATEKSNKYRIKYYKGLGTSVAKEAQDYFADLKTNRIEYEFNKKEDLPQLVNIFDSNFAEYRKKWITKALQNPQKIDYNKKVVPVNYFINRELVQFSIYDNVRSIPNVIDGLKPSQRKILFGCLKKNLFQKSGHGEIKVAQLSGYISEHTAYHHGEASLNSTIISMAQEFVGSGNMNLLMPLGEFGSRKEGGKDAASARYIFTALRPEVKILFNEHDNTLLNYQEEEGKDIEPDYYVPILPLILLNGSMGIGTGWKSEIPCFRLSTIVDNIKHLLKDEDDQVKTLIPYYKGFKGSIEKNGNSWTSTGCIEYVDANIVEVTELPIGMSKEEFKELLNKMISEDLIKSYEINDGENSKKSKKSSKKSVQTDFKTANDICYRIKLSKSHNENTNLIKFFKLEKGVIKGFNPIAFDEDGVIHCYDSPEDILYTFYNFRLKFYSKRKQHIINDLKEKIENSTEKMRFIEMVVNEEIIIFKQKKDYVIEQLKQNNFNNIDLLLSISISKFTKDEIVNIKQSIDELENNLENVKNKTVKNMWIEDLDKLDIEKLEELLVIDSGEKIKNDEEEEEDEL